MLVFGNSTVSMADSVVYNHPNHNMSGVTRHSDRQYLIPGEFREEKGSSKPFLN
jgi:hypothetical protein